MSKNKQSVKPKPNLNYFSTIHKNKKLKHSVIIWSDGKTYIEVAKHSKKQALDIRCDEKQTKAFFNKFLKAHFNGSKLNAISKGILKVLFQYKGEPTEYDKKNIRELVKMLRKELNG